MEPMTVPVSIDMTKTRLSELKQAPLPAVPYWDLT